MTDTNLDLLKKALTEGLSRKIDQVTSSYIGEVECSKKHTVAMRTIVRGKIPGKHVLTPKLKWAIAIVLSATLMLTGCAIKFRERIAGFIEEIFGTTITLTYADKKNAKTTIEEEYEFTYVPEGYVFISSFTEASTHRTYNYVNGDGKILDYTQIASGSAAMGVHTNSKEHTIYKIGEYEIYYRSYSEKTLIMWNHNGYTFSVISDIELTLEEFTAIVNGVVLKQQ